MGGRETDDDDTLERHTDTHKLTHKTHPSSPFSRCFGRRNSKMEQMAPEKGSLAASEPGQDTSSAVTKSTLPLPAEQPSSSGRKPEPSQLTAALRGVPGEPSRRVKPSAVAPTPWLPSSTALTSVSHAPGWQGRRPSAETVVVAVAGAGRDSGDRRVVVAA